MKQTLRQIVFLVLLSAVLALGRNTVAPGGIAWVGDWSGINPEVPDSALPESAAAGDPPFLTLKQALALHDDADVIFLDARYPDEFAAGAIPGALLLPFEEFDDYWPGVEPLLTRDQKIVTYCSGSECELSLFLARLLKDMGYTHVSIFFGGARLWSESGMPVDTGAAPPPGVMQERGE